MKTKLYYLFVLAFVSLGIVSCDSDDDYIIEYDEIRLVGYDEGIKEDADYTTWVTSMIVPVRYPEVDMYIIGGKGTGYSAVNSDNTVLDVSVDGKFLRMKILKAGSSTITMSDDADNKMQFPVSIADFAMNIKILEPFVWIKVKEETEENKSIIAQIESDIRQKLLEKGMHYKMEFEAPHTGKLSVYPQSASDAEAITGTFGEELNDEYHPVGYSFEYDSQKYSFQFVYDLPDGVSDPSGTSSGTGFLVSDLTSDYAATGGIELVEAWAIYPIEMW